MPVLIKTSNNKIVLQIFKGSPAFRNIVSLAKKYHCIYNPETHEWEISPNKFESLHEELSDIDRIVTPEGEDIEIEKILYKPSSIKKFNVVVDVKDLKCPPIKGKHPYENYQLEDLSKCYSTNRFALFLEQGTGKSWILITLCDLLKKYRGIKKVVFLTSSSGVYNIKKEFSRFSDITNITTGGVLNRRPFDDDVDVIIMNYRSFLLVSDDYQKDKNPCIKNYRKTPIPIEEWLNKDPGILILDESHNISNPKARQTKAVQLISPYFEYIYDSTGTPADMEQKYYSQLKILDPFLVKNLSYYEWLEEYFVLGDRYSQYRVIKIKSSKALELQKTVDSICSRRFADDVLELPEQYTRNYYVELTDIQRRIYQKVVLTKLEEIQNSFGYLSSHELRNTFPYLMSSIDNPKLLLKHLDKFDSSMADMVNSFEFKDHSKIEALQDILISHANSKIVIWTSHPSVGYELASLLGGYHPLVINGEVPLPRGYSLDQLKGKIVDQFQTDPQYKILIAGIEVMNSSVSLVSATIQIIFDSTFNYTEYDQALKRVRRIGQDKPVFTYKIIADNSLDVFRNKNLEQKDFINKKFLSKEYIDQQTAKQIFNMTA